MKIKELQRYLKINDLDAALIFSQDINYFYFTQINIEGSILLVPTKGKPTLFLSNLEDVKTSFKKVVYKDIILDLKNLFESKKIRTVGINELSVNVSRYKKLSKLVKLKDISQDLEQLRTTKTKEEVFLIKKACMLTESIFTNIVKDFNFVYENDIKKFIRTRAIDLDCELSFEPIIASGKDGAVPHYNKNKKLVKGFLVIDMGLKYKGYCADISRTLYLGKPSKKDLNLYNEILSVQKRAIKRVKSGVRTSELSKFVRKELDDKDKYFIHTLGHGLGLKVHESPRVSINSNSILEEGMVITIEPGYYNGFGIRIEDDILVEKDGYKILNKFPKELIIIPKF